MSKEMEGTSHSSEQPKKKKKFLYLDKFEAYVLKTDKDIKQLKLNHVVICCVCIILAVALMVSAILG